MSTKQMKFAGAAHAELRRGVQQLCDAVGVTMGPKGHNVILQKSWGGPSVTKDGVTVAKEVDLPEPFQNMGAKMVQQVAKKTADVAGDGTTCATVLAGAIFNGGLKYIASGANAVAIPPVPRDSALSGSCVIWMKISATVAQYADRPGDSRSIIRFQTRTTIGSR